MIFTGVLCCQGAAFDDLSNEESGQLILSHELRSILVFKKSVQKGNRSGYWVGVPYKGSETYNLDPAQCSVLDYTERSLTPESAALELAYWKCAGKSEKSLILTGAYRKIAEKINAPVTIALLAFYTELDEYSSNVIRESKQYRRALLRSRRNLPASASAPAQNTRSRNFNTWKASRQNTSQQSAHQQSAAEADVLMTSLKTALENDDCLKAVDKMVDNEKNFFIAVCMYLSYREKKLALLQMSGLGKDVTEVVRDDLQQAGEDIRTKFVQGRSYNKTREHAFMSLCPEKHGKWEFAPPADMRGMLAFVSSSYRAWHKTLNLSPYSEFPDWGNAALEVLQMFRNSALEQKFDAAYSEYRKNNRN